jgi:hypothetical protein
VFGLLRVLQFEVNQYFHQKLGLVRKMYHTQEKWSEKLKAPCKTHNPHAWLGPGYYFWYSEHDAVVWGNTAKRDTGYYEIYTANINCEKVLDTVFNEEHYLFWIDQIEKAITKFVKKQRDKITLKDINNVFKSSGLFDDVDGVMFQDISKYNTSTYLASRFQFKKRIQIAVYNLNIITNFVFSSEGKCVINN